MLGNGSDLNLPRSIQVLLDGHEVEMPDHVPASLDAIRSYLDLIALRQERVVASLSVDGLPAGAYSSHSQASDFQCIQAQTISFGELSCQLITTAQQQVQSLQAKVEAAAMQVLINDWPAVEKLWREWVPEFLSPILIIKSLRELCGARIEELSINGRSLADHLAAFNPLWGHLETIFVKHDILELSNALEQMLGPWLDGLNHFLAKLNEP